MMVTLLDQDNRYTVRADNVSTCNICNTFIHVLYINLEAHTHTDALNLEIMWTGGGNVSSTEVYGQSSERKGRLQSLDTCS